MVRSQEAFPPLLRAPACQHLSCISEPANPPAQVHPSRVDLVRLKSEDTRLPYLARARATRYRPEHLSEGGTRAESLEGRWRWRRGEGAGCRGARVVRDVPHGRRGVLDGLCGGGSEVCNYVRYFPSYSSRCLSVLLGHPTRHPRLLDIVHLDVVVRDIPRGHPETETEGPILSEVSSVYVVAPVLSEGLVDAHILHSVSSDSESFLPRSAVVSPVCTDMV